LIRKEPLIISAYNTQSKLTDSLDESSKKLLSGMIETLGKVSSHYAAKGGDMRIDDFAQSGAQV